MAYEVVYEDSFERDYKQAVNYLAVNPGNPQAASNLVSYMRNAASVLKSEPLIRAVSSKAALSAHGMREYFIGNYVIVYRVDELACAIKFYRLFHQSQNYDSEWYWANSDSTA